MNGIEWVLGNENLADKSTKETITKKSAMLQSMTNYQVEIAYI